MEQFKTLCSKGKLKDAQLLLLSYPNISLDEFQTAFCYACCYGQLKVAQWLLEMKPVIDISANDEYTFYLTCIYGHFKVAQWLLQVKPTIDISSLNECTFRDVCKYGHLEIAQLLLHFASTISNRIGGIDISANNNFAFRYACINRQLKIVEWLLQIRPDKYVMNNNSEPIIRTEQEQLWYKIQYLIELSENKKHKLYKLSMDIIWFMSFYI